MTGELMKVEVEGKIEERAIDYYEINESRRLKPVPQLRGGEEALYTVSGQCIIIKRHEPSQFDVGIDHMRPDAHPWGGDQ